VTKTLLAAAMLLAAVTAAQAAPQMPVELIGEWCSEGGACPDGVMRATRKGSLAAAQSASWSACVRVAELQVQRAWTT
jgi:hypothetical protein